MMIRTFVSLLNTFSKTVNVKTIRLIVLSSMDVVTIYSIITTNVRLVKRYTFYQSFLELFRLNVHFVYSSFIMVLKTKESCVRT